MDYNQRISVAIVALEKADKLIDLVASIVPQLSETDEVLIVVDPRVQGIPSDMTLEVAWEIAQQLPLVRVIVNERMGRNAGYELAIKACEGDVVFLAEPGDLWKPDKVETVMNTLAASGTALVLHDAQLYTPKLGEGSYALLYAVFGAMDSGKETDLTAQQIHDSFVGSCMAFKVALRQFFLPFPQGVILYDQWMGLVAEKYGGVALINRPLISKTVGDGTDTLSSMLVINERHGEQRKLLKALKKRQKELDALLQG